MSPLFRQRISPPLPSQRSRDEVLNLVLERHRSSKDYYDSVRRKAARWYQFYRGWYRGQAVAQYRNNVTLPLIYSTIWSDVARKTGVLFGQFPYQTLVGGGQEDWPQVRQYELILSAQMDDADIFTRSVRFLLAADIYGTACAQTGWRYQEELLVPRRMASAYPSLYETQSEAPEPIVAFDGPDWEPFDIVDTFPQPKVAELARMKWFIRRYTLDLEDCQLYAKFGIFDKGPVRELEMLGIQNDMEDSLKESRSIAFVDISPDLYSRPVQLLEMWGLVPNEFAKDGSRFRVITVANEQVVLRNRPSPLQTAQLPIIAASPIVDPHYFFGPSKVEIGERFQFTASRITNQKLDAMDLVVDPMWVFDRNSNLATRDLFTRAGKLIGVDGVPSQVLQALTPDLRGLQLSYTEIEQLWRWYQAASGIIEDTVMGGPGGADRQTAREYLGRVESVSTRLLLETRIIEEMFLRPLAKKFLALNKQFLTVPTKRSILGTGAIVDPVTGMPIADQAEVWAEDIERNYDVRPRASVDTLPKSAQQQNLIVLLQAMGSNPMAAQVVNWLNFYREVFRKFGVPNVDEMIMTGPQQQLAALLAQGQQLSQNAVANMGAMGAPPMGQGSMQPLPALPGGENTGQAELE